MGYDKPIKLLISIIICELAGVVGSAFTVPSIESWYASIAKPNFNPPNWVFAPVWTTLFVLMGISLYLVWSSKFVVKNELKVSRRKPWNRFSEKFLSGKWQKINIILIFSTQLVLNVLWSVIFFGMHSVGAAFFELLMLWVAVVFTIVNFYRVSKAAAWLLSPYLLWVSFAAVLNLAVFLLNK